MSLLNELFKYGGTLLSGGLMGKLFDLMRQRGKDRVRHAAIAAKVRSMEASDIRELERLLLADMRIEITALRVRDNEQEEEICDLRTKNREMAESLETSRLDRDKLRGENHQLKISIETARRECDQLKARVKDLENVQQLTKP